MLASLALLALTTAPSSGSAQDVVLEPQPARWRILFGELDVPGQDLGLLGVHYDVLQPLQRFPELYFGIGGWAAVTGDRGGLLTGGFTLGYLRELGAGWFLDAGLFVGGGGGGGANENDGLLLRPHLALERTFDLYGLRLEIADLDIDGTDVNDVYFSTGFSLLSEALYAKEGRRAGRVPDEALLQRRLRAGVRVLRFSPSSGTRRRNGIPLGSDADMLGVGLDYFLSPHVFVPLEAYGAASGSIDGFAMGLVGLGVEIPFIDPVSLEVQASIGSGGGGGVDTGGGFLVQARAGLRANVWKGLDVELGGGYMTAPSGEMEGALISGGLAWNVGLTELHPAYPRSALARQAVPRKKAKVVRPGFEVLHKFYRPGGDALRKNGGPLENTLSLVGLGIAWPVLDWLELTGRAYGAYDGGIGGYAEGFFGARYSLRPFEDRRHTFTAAGSVGVGGGGGLDVGSGVLYELSGGYRYRVAERATVFLEFGTVEADQGSFKSESWNLGLAWDLGLPVLR